MQTASSAPALVAGVAAGEVGLLVFLTIHHLTIRPIWFILPVGAVIAALSGAAVGWAFFVLRPALPGNIWLASLALAALLTLTQLPGFFLGYLREPLVDMETATIPPEKTRSVVIAFAVELFLTAVVVGGLLGLWLGRDLRSAGVMALAAVLFALGPGHNVPFFPGTSGETKLWLIMGAFILSAALAFPTVYGLLAGMEN